MGASNFFPQILGPLCELSKLFFEELETIYANAPRQFCVPANEASDYVRGIDLSRAYDWRTDAC
jgi:hypothetical protein